MMKMRGLLVAAVILAALAGTLYWSNHHKSSADSVAASSSTPTVKVISLTQADINKLEIKKKDSDIVLNRMGPSNWKIISPKPLVADQDPVSTILYNFSPMDGATLIDDKATDLKQFGLADPDVQVTATQKDGKSTTVLVGDDTPTGDSAYVMVSGESKIYSVPTSTKTSFDKSLTDLEDKHLLPVDYDKIGSIEVNGPKLRMTFGSDNGHWTIRSPAGVRGDTSMLETIVEKLRTATVDPSTPAIEEKQAAGAFAAGSSVATIRATDASGSQELQVRKDKDSYYAKTTAMDGVYKVPKELGDAVSKNIEDYREKRVFDFAENDPDKLELHDGSKAYYLTRSGEDWWSGEGKKLDPLSVEDFLRPVRTLEAKKFVDSGFASPTINLVVTSNDGKRVEKVNIARSGDGYIAKREDGPTLYELDAKSIDDIEKAAAGLKPEAPPSPAKK